MPRKFVERRAPSGVATCIRYLGDFHGVPLICGAEMQLLVYHRTPAIVECCTAGHTALIQDVLQEADG